MKSGKSTSIINTKSWLRIRAILLYVLVALLVCSTAVLVFAETFTNVFENIDRIETREQIKSRLLWQARYEGWDPYSADMTLDEFYALMELFDEGKLPLGKNASTIAGTNSTSDETFTIPRTKFLLDGIPEKYTKQDGENGNENFALDYQNNNNYEPYGEDEKNFYYPEGLDKYNKGYKRPPLSWSGVGVDSSTKRALVVLEKENENPAIASKVDQDLFPYFEDYYVKQVTVDGADINILGMLQIPGTNQYVCYFLSAEEQSTQVSTTTMPDPDKFIVEYVPVEHMVNYTVTMADGSDVPNGIDEDIIFGSYHPYRTTDGAYSFDVTVPYGYTVTIYISINMTIDVPYVNNKPDNMSFPVRINHTGTYEEAKKSWLTSYYDYLVANNFFSSEVSYEGFLTSYIDITTEKNGKITITWKDADDPDKDAHDSVLERMTERINDFMLHNNGWALGTYPVYDTKGPGGFRLLPNESKGPKAWTMTDTFYNHLVKADRTIEAVLTELEAPTFDVRKILELSNGAANRGAAATEKLANNASHVDDNEPNRTADYYPEDMLLADYAFHENNGANASGDFYYHANVLHNLVEIDNGQWNWQLSTFLNEAKYMFYNAEDGTYSYTWMFQTNAGDYLMDVLEINGIGMLLPYSPLYKYNTKYDGPAGNEDQHPWYVENKLADGATVRIELVMLFGNTQRIYRIIVTGARSNVVVTGMNLMDFGNGGQEVSIYNLVGVYSDQNGENQTSEAVEYYGKESITSSIKTWFRKAKSNVIISVIDYDKGDPQHKGANIRFKIADGYGHPYYMYSSPRYGLIKGKDGLDQTSAQFDKNGNITGTNKILHISEAGETLDSQHIYDGGDGYYYIRVTGQGVYNEDNGTYDASRYPIALLTVIARTVRYVVRYIPFSDDVEKPDNMPTFDHNGDCAFKDAAIGEQYDDNGGAYYDLLVNKMMSIPSNAHGVIRPTDPNKRFKFVDWVLVDEDYNPVLDSNGNYIQFLSGAIDLTTISHYAVHRVDFSQDDVDIYVIRFMPYWKEIDSPFVYDIVINWVDALGKVNQDKYSDWDDIITEKPETGGVYVYINKVATPFLNWFALHPTYTFWDAVNNALSESEIEDALNKYLNNVHHADKYNDIYDELIKLDYTGNGKPDFERLGSDIFVVTESGGTIVIWMYESLGGVVFNTDVREESFVHDDEFYFTVTNPSHSINGTYRAFPQYVFGDGSQKDLNDEDAWLVTFKDGVITSIVKDGVNYGTYFTLKKGEEVALYVPMGTYKIYELGSKSGSPYKIDVQHHDSKWENNGSSWQIPEGDLWLKGSSKQITNNNPNVSQICADVTLEIGEREIVEVLTFYNQTTSLSIENRLGTMTPQQATQYKSKDFAFKVTLSLSENQTPFKLEDGTDYYYFNMNIYRIVDGKTVATTVRLQLKQIVDDSKGNNIWEGTLQLKPEERAVIVMTGDIAYWVEEIETYGLVAIWTGQNGRAQEGKKSSASCTNCLEENVPKVTHGYLVITETGGKSNESFLFKITCENGSTITVSVKGGSKTYVYAPLGKYTIEEISDWSWRYETGKEISYTVEITVLNATKDTAVKANYSHNPNNKGWLGGESSNDSFFTAA